MLLRYELREQVLQCDQPVPVLVEQAEHVAAQLLLEVQVAMPAVAWIALEKELLELRLSEPF